MDLSWMTRRLSGLSDGIAPSLMEAMAAMSDNVDAGMRLVREIAGELRPGVLDAAGLIGAIEWQAARFRERSGVECNLDLPSEEEFQFDRNQSTELFRIFQEILTNVARHAKATVVSAALTIEPGEVVLNVQDKGRGIAEAEINEPKSFGILGMRERTAALGGELVLDLAAKKARPLQEILSNRELQVLGMIASGKRLIDIAEALSLSMGER